MSDAARSRASELRRDPAGGGSDSGPDRVAAQRRVNRIRAFRAELDALTSANAVTLTAEQQGAIERYHDELLRRLAKDHDVDQSDAAGQLSRGMRIAAFLAAVALTAAISSLVSRFWGRLDLPVQASLLCAFPLVSLVAVELTAQRERTLYISSIFALAAFGTYWVAVVTLGQLLNVPLTPAVVWGGALFGLALALPYGFRVILAGALLALLAALTGSMFQAAGMPWTLVAEYPEIVTGAALALTVLAPRLQQVHASFGAVTRLVAFGVAFCGLLLLSTAGQASLLPVAAHVTRLVYQGVMLVLSVATLGLAIRRQWLETVYLSAGALTLFLFVRFVDWFWEALPRYLFFLLLAGVALTWLLALRRLRRRLGTERV
jgi:hypothetical protein